MGYIIGDDGWVNADIIGQETYLLFSFDSLFPISFFSFMTFTIDMLML